MFSAIASARRTGNGVASLLPRMISATLEKRCRFDSTQNFEPVKTQTVEEGFPIVVASAGSFAIAGEIHRQDVLRFFSACNLTEEDVMVQYSATFRPVNWWIRFHSEEDRRSALSMKHTQWGGRNVNFEKRTLSEWKDGTFNHLMMNSFGSAALVTRLTFDTTPADLASFFRNFHLQGNGVTLLEDPLRPNVVEQSQFKRAIVRLISKQEAQRAARALHGKHLRTNKVIVRVLQ